MILVTGAGGTIGTALVKALRAGGHACRAAHHSSEKAEEARNSGREAVRVDFAAPETLAPALQGVEVAFLLHAGIRNQAEQELNFIKAAKAAGVKKLVKLSIWRASEEEYAIARMHRTVEKAIEASGFDWTFLRPNGFMQNFVRVMAPAINTKGAMFQPAGDTKVSFIDTRDIAVVAARVLTTPGHEGKAYELSGPESLAYADAARILSNRLGRAIKYVPVTDADARAGMVAGGMPEYHADALIDLFRAYREGIARSVTPAVANLLDREPTRFEQFVRDHAHAFDPSQTR